MSKIKIDDLLEVAETLFWLIVIVAASIAVAALGVIEINTLIS